MKRMLALMGLLAVPALAENPAPESRAGVPQAAFDDVRYALGYDVYVAGGNLPAAWQVARKAVSQNPGDPVWLKRYAQVSEWIGQPAEAGRQRWRADEERWVTKIGGVRCAFER